MKQSQEFLLTMFKIMHVKVFENLLTKDEMEMKRKFDGYNFYTERELNIQKDNEGNTLLTWKSATGKTIACPVTSVAFLFSQTGVFDEGYVFDLLTYFNFETYKVEMVEAEIEDTKRLLNMITPVTLPTFM